MPHPKRTVFVSYYGGDNTDARAFLDQWAVRIGVFTPRILGEEAYTREGLIQSNNPDYVMGQIRQRYIADASVTLLLVGTCTHSRRYIDWELKATLRRGESLPNGLLAILLPSAQRDGSFPALPERFSKNYDQGSNPNSYARYYFMPSTTDELDRWIEDAVVARTTRSGLIQNDAEMMAYNARCRVHGVTH
jgi:hypothetical protein